ncbi:MAG: amino acid permease [Methanomicrobiaceae archaeon]|nr:amino acid permease [Methanomicrobiaceae archaeon]
MEYKKLTFFDLTNIVIGSIIGADVYVASGLAAGMIGPFAIVCWAVAGIFATIIALVFAYCSYFVPRVGGPFAYVSAAFDDFYGFLTGWSIWIAEMLALPVFAIAFVRYLQYFTPLDPVRQIAVQGAFVCTLTAVNVAGVRVAGRVNDVLTIIKLLPLVMLVAAGAVVFALNPAVLSAHYIPFIPFGLEHFGSALVIIFWAYAGFELGTLPAEEVENPDATIPKAIGTGMAIVAIFYLSTNFVVYGSVPSGDLAASPIPLVLAASVLLGSAGALIVSIGALVSVSGSNESNTLGTARLSFAMAAEGLFPKIFARIHPEYGTPYAALAIQGIIAFTLSAISEIPRLISFAVFSLSFAYLLTCLALLVLAGDQDRKLRGQTALPVAGIAVCLYLLVSTPLFDLLSGAAVILAGIPLYVYFSPKTDIRHVKDLIVSEEAIVMRRLEQKNLFLARFVQLLHAAYFEARRILRRPL